MISSISFGGSTFGSVSPGGGASGVPETEDFKKSPTEEFLDWARMTPAERIRAQYLESQGLSEDQLAALPPTERERIERQIAQRIKEQLAGETGQRPQQQGATAPAAASGPAASQQGAGRLAPSTAQALLALNEVAGADPNNATLPAWS